MSVPFAMSRLALVCRREWTFKYSDRPCLFRISLNRYFSQLPRNLFRRKVTIASFCCQPIPRTYDLYQAQWLTEICGCFFSLLFIKSPTPPAILGLSLKATSQVLQEGLEPQLRVRRRDTPIHFPQTGSPVATVIVSQRDARISQSLGSLSGCADIWRQPAYYKAWRAQQLAH